MARMTKKQLAEQERAKAYAPKSKLRRLAYSMKYALIDLEYARTHESAERIAECERIYAHAQKAFHASAGEEYKALCASFGRYDV